ncbi:hypothetical protein [Prevotella sp. OH937_COT-195]|uniref:hypothetical protein n=1 Tax=Prevotella sp. OH937_COT-195 TaxID=2491051 RepID=UPI000F65134B|nr:hypothetical protein [Prevotella sp. OH937_COT-195]RRD02539.1 hypothetical protein EII32_02455 [Prevotella sp. OH937_COT-195]
MKKLLIVLAAVTAISCMNKKKVGETQKENDKACKYDVYVLGAMQKNGTADNDETDFPETRYDMVYWKNGVPKVIADKVGTPDGYDLFSIFDMIVIEGKFVFLGSATINDMDGATYFIYKSGKFTRIGDKEDLEKPKLLDVDGKPVVVGGIPGTDEDATIIYQPAMWSEDGSMKTFDLDGFKCNEICGVAAENGNIYACGRVYRGNYENGYGALWKNGKLTTYPAPNNGTTMFGFTAIAVSGGNIYTTMISNYGEPEYDELTLWKNGMSVRSLGENGVFKTADCIVADGNDIYVGGSESRVSDDGNETLISMPRIWKNGKAMNIDNNNEMGWIKSMTVAGGKVYATGDVGFLGAVWSNGKCETLKGAKGEGTTIKIIVVPAKK